MLTYSLRLTLDDDDSVKQFLGPYNKVLVCKENPDTEVSRIHYHTLIKTELKLATFRARLKVHFGKEFAGNSHYSIKSIENDEKAVLYLCKGLSKTKEPLIIINSYDINSVERHQKYWENNEKIKYETKEKPKDECIQYITNLFGPEVKPTDNTLKEYTSRKYKDVNGIPTDVPSEELICNTMLDWYTSRGYPIPHRTTGTTIIKQSVYNIYPIATRNSNMHEYYGIRHY